LQIQRGASACGSPQPGALDPESFFLLDALAGHKPDITNPLSFCQDLVLPAGPTNAGTHIGLQWRRQHIQAPPGLEQQT
jgi:hypothetical protein